MARTNFSDQIVEGFAADGAAAVNNPIIMGGVDGNGNVQSVLTDTAGVQQVALAASTALTGTPVETAVSVGTGSTAVVAANASRKFLQLINDSPNIIYVSFSGSAALNTGTRLNANGGAATWSAPDYVPTSAVKAISGTASSDLLVTEG